MKKENITGGAILIIIGCVILLNSVFHLQLFSMEFLWPLFILIPGLIFEIGYFASGRNPGLLVPGGILTTIGLQFFFQTYTNFAFAEYTWPIYPLAVAIGLFQLYLFSGRHKGLLFPVFILGGVSVISFSLIIFSWANQSLIIGAVITLLGIFLLFKKNRNA